MGCLASTFEDNFAKNQPKPHRVSTFTSVLGTGGSATFANDNTGESAQADLIGNLWEGSETASNDIDLGNGLFQVSPVGMSEHAPESNAYRQQAEVELPRMSKFDEARQSTRADSETDWRSSTVSSRRRGSVSFASVEDVERGTLPHHGKAVPRHIPSDLQQQPARKSNYSSPVPRHIVPDQSHGMV
jgi:hypothetical protein